MRGRAVTRRILWLLLPALLTCGVVQYVRPAAWRPHTQDELLTHPIYAYRQWQSTGIELEAGDGFNIKAGGEWQYSPLVGLHGPEGGMPAPPAYPLSRAPGGALIGRIGETGAPFYVGRQTTGYAEAPGLLYLRINDDLLGDNQGKLALEIEIEPEP